MRNPLRLFVFVLLAAALGAASADAATRGVRIKDGATVLAEVVDGVVTGELAVPPGEISPTLEVFWLDDVLAEVQPAGRTLAFTIADPGIATFAAVGTWTFTLEGLVESSTSATLAQMDGATAEYTSPAIPLHVEEAHAEADGYVARRNGVTEFMVWQGTPTGFAVAPLGADSDTLEFAFLSVDSLEFVPHVKDGFALVLQIGDTLVATQAQTGDWTARLHGESAGATTLRVGIFHVDHVDFLAPAVPLQVYAGAGAEPVALGALSFSGAVPNPVRSRASLPFVLGRAMDVELSLYDVTGRRVSTLLSGPLPAGSHRAALDSAGLRDGVYFARLVTPAGTFTRRLTLAR